MPEKATVYPSDYGHESEIVMIHIGPPSEYASIRDTLQKLRVVVNTVGVGNRSETGKIRHLTNLDRILKAMDGV